MIAFHAIVSAYGFWLPNDPRGSWSNYVGSSDLYHSGGAATKVSTTRSLAQKPHNQFQRRAVKAKLKYPPVRFSGRQALSIAKGFEHVADQSGYTVLALAIMPTHTHLVIGDCERKPTRLVGHLKRGATDRMIQDGLHPCFQDERITHTCWAKQSWTVYLDTEAQVRRTIRYVDDNPVKDGLPRQQWAFVQAHRRNFLNTIGPASGRANQ